MTAFNTAMILYDSVEFLRQIRNVVCGKPLFKDQAARRKLTSPRDWFCLTTSAGDEQAENLLSGGGHLQRSLMSFRYWEAFPFAEFGSRLVSQAREMGSCPLAPNA
ncbi:hypothetical protein Zmor_020348 [Zophobas morio]|uniref:Uncharacterized protein n=1 Tax=Zophobas morio TaxID=2755281 RepID=A0AA38I172_9CUCU|nr:hypothetical protein Zmor_020348 [Zophobas morio]